jgi:N-acetyl-gamma-glutamyl-phosphate reductase
MTTVGIIGGSGYTGGELVRLVLQHPALELEFVYSRSQAGKALHEVHPDLYGQSRLHFTQEINANVNVLFLCMGHGKSREFLSNHPVSTKTIIIDLSQDFRNAPTNVYQDRNFVYCLPELQSTEIENATAIANPGCFATAIALALLPLAKANALQQQSVHVHATTGSTGAGVLPSETSHFSWRAANMSWYKPFTHQHLTEIQATLQQDTEAIDLIFLPHRGPFARGIFATAYTQYNGTLKDAYSLYENYYAQAPFTHVVPAPVHLKQVTGSNNCMLHLHLHDNILLITSVIDNLIKGAAGQALQNLNLIMGWEEHLGLQLKTNIF